ncbi:MAG: aconitase X swivel domain-containing protein [Vicinamibacteria bacterium]
MSASSYHLSIEARVVVAGRASGIALVSSEPLSFWGGYDPKTGEILDRRHPLSGRCAAGRVLAIPFTKGSSTTTQILLEAIRGGKAPSAIVSRGEDAFLALASIVADEMYRNPIPILAVSPEDFDRLRTGQKIAVEETGRIEVDDEGES